MFDADDRGERSEESDLSSAPSEDVTPRPRRGRPRGTKRAPTERACKAQRWFAECPNQTAVARQLGVSQQVVSDWANRQDRPGLDMALHIEETLGIDVHDWGQFE
jgi:hypothetical protein